MVIFESAGFKATCELRACTLDKSRHLSLSGLMEHTNKVHLSRVHVPCPVAGLQVIHPFVLFCFNKR